MKVGSRCGYCLLHRGHKMINLSTDDEGARLRAMEALLKLMGEQFCPEAVPSVIGAERGRVIARVTGCLDPYRELKRTSNEQALRILPDLRKRVNSKPPEERDRMTSRRRARCGTSASSSGTITISSCAGVTTPPIVCIASC